LAAAAAVALDRKEDEEPDAAADDDGLSGDRLTGVPPTRNGLAAGDRLTGDMKVACALSVVNRPDLDGVNEACDLELDSAAGGGGGELDLPALDRDELAADVDGGGRFAGSLLLLEREVDAAGWLTTALRDLL
jgi:hypothetical protein